MKKLILLFSLFTLAAISYGQGNWTLSGAKNRWANGMGFGNKDTSTYTNASDTNLLVLQYPGVLVYRHLLSDHWEILSYNSTVSNYKLISDSLFNAGYTRRDRTKQGLDSLGALKLNISDTAAALANYPLKDGTRATGTWNIGVTGNAGTATLLQTARNINGVSFNGSADITVTAAAGTLTGSTLNSSVTASSLTSVGTLVSGSIPYSLLSGTVPTWNQNTTGTAANITATSNSTITTLSSLSLPYSQLTGTPSLSGYVPYTGATSAVNLGSNSLTAGDISGSTGDFSSYISVGTTLYINPDNYIYFDNLGSLNYSIRKTGTALTFNTNGTYNFLSGAATFASSVTASSFIKSGGTSSQFLKADGSVDNNTYLTSADISGKLNISDTASMLSPYLRKTDTASMLSNRLKISDTSSMLSNYRRKTTLINYNELSGTVPTWNQNTTGTAANITATSNSTITTLSSLSLPYSQLTGTPSLSGYVPYTGATSAVNLGSNSLTAGDISGSTGDFSSYISVGTTLYINPDNYIYFDNGGSLNYSIRKTGTALTFNTNGTYNFLSGAATFASSVTASSLIKSGGTSSQFLKADGSVDGNTYLTSAVTSLTGTANQVSVSASTGAVTVSLPSAVTISGNMTAAAFFESSDKRLKDYTYQNTSLDGLRTVSFFWKPELNRDNKQHWGYLAQDVEKILPDQVNTGSDGYKTVNYTEVLVYKISVLEKRITKLEKQLNK